MRAIRQHEFGPPEVLVPEDVDDPAPGPGQVRIAVRAAGVHLLDTAIRAGQAGPMPLPALPFVPGREVAGVVDAAGPDVDGAWVGRRVVAHLGPASGGYAELAVREVAEVLPIPEVAGRPPLDDAAAVAMVGTGRTTLAILEFTGGLGPGEVVLVTAAAGGIGGLLIQAARRAGAAAVALAGGPDKVAATRRLGADLSVDYRAAGWADEVRRGLDALGLGAPTVAFDGVGGEAGRQAFELLAPGGRLVAFGWSSGEPTALTLPDLVGRGVTAIPAIGPRLLGRPGGFRDLSEAAVAAAAAGDLVPLVHPPFALKDAAEAHRALAGRATIGKVVLVP
jgi:NADPH:quinone reductase